MSQAEETGTAHVPIVGFDGLRALGAFGIVWFHTPGTPGHDVAYAGLPLFLLMTFFLQGRAHEARQSLRTLAIKRCSRLLVPWLFWYAFYGVQRLRDLSASGRPLRIPTVGELLTGPCVPLWYLPFATFAAILVAALWRPFAKVGAEAQVAFATLLAATLLLLEPWTTAAVATEPFSQYSFSAAAVLFGFAAGRAWQLGERVRRLAWAIAGVLFVAVASVLVARGYLATGLSYGIASILFVMVLLLPVRRVALVATLASSSMGVYLLHPFTLRMALHLSVPAPAQAMFAFVTAGLVAAALRRHPWGARIT